VTAFGRFGGSLALASVTAFGRFSGSLALASVTAFGRFGGSLRERRGGAGKLESWDAEMLKC